MDIVKTLILTIKTKNSSHVGYGLQSEFESLVGYILQNMAKSSLPPLTIDNKNEENSMKYREEGNEYFVGGDDEKAIESYTKSLAYANTNELKAYAHANRSAALYRKKMFNECLIDIMSALELNYPSDKRKKLEERGIKAMEEIKKLKNPSSNNNNNNLQTNQTCPLAMDTNCNKKFPLVTKIENDDPVKNNDKNLSDFELLIQTEIGKLSLENKIYKSDIIKPRYLDNPEVMSVPYGPSNEAPANSAGIKIKFSAEYGRHLVATSHFKPGDIMTIEDPYCWVIYRDKFYTHCHYCLERCYTLIPCPDCPIAQYCSDKCRKLAWKTAHKIECPVLSVLVNLLNMDEDKVRMVMKIIQLLVKVTSCGEKIKELREDLKVAETNPDDKTAGFTDDGVLDSTSARSALSLATNVSTRPVIGLSAFACISALATMLLSTQTLFFGRKYQLQELRDLHNYPDVKFCGAIMLRACVITSSNCFSIQPEPGIKSGSGLYVAHSLYNHSCAPNTFRHFEGLTMITRAMEPIEPGQQIFTGYGADYSYMPRDKRKEKLMEEYFFDCQCPGCVNDWPTYSDVLKNHTNSIKQNKTLVQRLKPYKKRLLENKYDIDAVKEVLSILHKQVDKPCEEILHAVQYLRTYYLGKLHKSI